MTSDSPIPLHSKHVASQFVENLAVAVTVELTLSLSTRYRGCLSLSDIRKELP